MSFPQPSSAAAVLTGQDYFRLLTPIVSPGDTYQSEASGRAFAIGPESDLANILVSYYDDNLSDAGFLNTLLVTNRAPFIGLIEARNNAKYQPSGAPGRIIYQPADFIPLVASSAARQFIEPTLDIIQYFGDPPAALPLYRNDKSYYFNDYPTAGGTYTLLIPYYGRVFGELQFSGGDATVTVEGLNYYTSNAALPTTLVAATALGATGLTKIIKSSVDGLFHYIRITMTGGTGLNIRTFIRFSDVPQ